MSTAAGIATGALLWTLVALLVAHVHRTGWKVRR